MDIQGSESDKAVIGENNGRCPTFLIQNGVK